ncbi:hypothetical protein SDC9_143465 [bioreactor metagenome]|uniref:Uncharacterized protein n=1 Tax=bioreactor metagenome TaxID=1076179 RepID=A0A645E3M0_9ZZZZ
MAPTFTSPKERISPLISFTGRLFKSFCLFEVYSSAIRYVISYSSHICVVMRIFSSSSRSPFASRRNNSLSICLDASLKSIPLCSTVSATCEILFFSSVVFISASCKSRIFLSNATDSSCKTAFASSFFSVFSPRTDIFSSSSFICCNSV